MRSLTIILLAAFFVISSAASLVPNAYAGSVEADAGKGSAISPAAGRSSAELLNEAREEKSRGRYGKAIRLYRSALTGAPIERQNGISVELATVQGWNGDYKGAIDTFTGVLASDPFNTEARLGLARTYGWAKEYEKAKTEYAIVLEGDPGSAQAKIGLARVHSWDGELREATALYREVLAKDPANEEARLGLSKVLWWGGDLRGAFNEAAIVMRSNPSNLEASRLERKLRTEIGPELTVQWASSRDSDADELTTYKASGYFNINPLARLDVDYTRVSASRYAQKAHADILSVRDSVRFTKEIAAKARLSLVSTGSNAGGRDYLAGGLSVYWDFYRDTTAVFSYNLMPLVDTPTLIENNIRLGELSASVMRHWKDVTGSLRAAYGSYSDDNSSAGLRGNIAWKLRTGPDVVVGYIPEYKAFSKTTNSGYYNPGHIMSNTLYVTLSGGLYADKVEYELTGTAGLQSTDSGTDSTSSVKAKVTGRLTRNLSAFAGYKWSRSALESATGFRYEEFMAGLDYLF